MQKRIIILALALLIASSASSECNFTHYEFYSKYSLGKQDELNKTFDQLLPTIKIPDHTYEINDSLSYKFSDVNLSLFYRDSRQKAEIMGKDTVVIDGGKLFATIGFKWIKTNYFAKTNGTATAAILSSEIIFQKLLQPDMGYLYWKLAHSYDIAFWSEEFEMIRFDPPNKEEADKIIDVISASDDSSMKIVMQKQINKNYPETLKNNLKNQHYPLDDHFDYDYFDRETLKNVTIAYSLIPTGVDLEPEGLSLTFVVKIKDDQKWKCGKAIPSEELNPEIYGGLQEFVSFSIFSNTVRYAFESGHLDSHLTKRNWESRFFQFYAGDLYQVIPAVAQTFYATQQVTGICIFNPAHEVEVIKVDPLRFNVTTDHHCSLTIANEKVAEFSILLKTEVEIEPKPTHLDFRVYESEGVTKFQDVGKYSVKNIQLAQLMLKHSLNRLKEGKTFGSGWKIYPRDYPHVLLLDDYVVIYDSSHVASDE